MHASHWSSEWYFWSSSVSTIIHPWSSWQVYAWYVGWWSDDCIKDKGQPVHSVECRKRPGEVWGAAICCGGLACQSHFSWGMHACMHPQIEHTNVSALCDCRLYGSVFLVVWMWAHSTSYAISSTGEALNLLAQLLSPRMAVWNLTINTQGKNVLWVWPPHGTFKNRIAGLGSNITDQAVLRV